MTFQCLKENSHPQIWIEEMKIVNYLMIGATIRIGREILCLPYAGFFLYPFVLFYFGPFDLLSLYRFDLLSFCPFIRYMGKLIAPGRKSLKGPCSIVLLK